MPVEAKNTLRSRARYKIVDVISEGPVKGLVNGAQSIYLDDTVVQNRDGSYNFPNFSPSRDIKELPIAGYGSTMPIYPGSFPASENTVSVGVKITKDNPEGEGSGDGSATRTITDASLDAVRVTVRVPALSTTNLTTGDITGGKIRFNIFVKPDGGTFAAASSGSQWEALAAHDSETDDGATGIEATATHAGGSSPVAVTCTWQYRKKTGETWGDWLTYAAVVIPATSSSSDNRGYYNQWSTEQTFTKSITGLPPGIYQTQVVTTPKGVAATSARQFIENVIEIEGKTVSPYDASYLISLPDGGAPWDVKVVRVSDDNTASQYQDDLYWLSYTEIINNRFSWPNIAGMQIAFDAESFGGNIPARAYDYMGLMIEIPSNYDPFSRTYDGVWDGTFQTEWTDNPAFIFYNLLINKRWGLGIPAAQVDKWGLYTIAQYCDELVDAPNGEQEPRYTCSTVINSQQEAYELLTAIASAFRGMIYWSNGAITATADMPTDTLINVGPANVIDGEFTYQGASRKSRHSVARVSWNNPDDGYKLNVEIYEDTEAIRKYGYRPIDINAIGCTSRGLARRWAKWQITSDNDAPDTVTYKASFDHFMTQGKAVRPGDVVAIADPNYSAEQNFGRIVSVVDNVSPETHTITLDRDVTLIGGDDSELQLTLADGSALALDVSVVSTVTDDTIIVASASLTTIPLAGATWLLKKETVEPRLWRVFSVTEPEPHIYQVSAMLYSPTKYDSIETGLNFEEANFSAMPTGEMPAPTGVLHSEFLKQTGSAIIACVNLSWTRPNDPRADLFEIQYQLDGEDWRATEPNITNFTGVDIINIVPGTYNFRVRAQDTTGLFKSAWTTYASKVIVGKNKAPEDVEDFTAVIEKYGVLMNWSPVSDIDINYYEIRYGASWAAGTFVGRAKGTTFKWEDATAAAYTFWIKAFDTQTPPNESANATSVLATVVVEAAPTVTSIAVVGGIEVAIAGAVTNRFAHYELQRKQTTQADGDAVTIVGILGARKYVDNYVATVGYSPLWQYRARAINKNLNESAYSSWSTGIAPLQISGSDMVIGALSNSNLFAAGVVDAAAIASAAVTEAKIGLAAVTNTKIGAAAIQELQLANDAVTAAKLAVSGIDGTTGAVAAGAVAELQLASNAVTEAKIAAAAVNTAQINNAALKAPLGAVASWSAKNCTTASIAIAGGVRDVSGNSLHGVATGGAAISSVAEKGPVFAFDGVDGIINIGNPASLQLTTSFTISIWVYNLDTTTDGGGLFQKKSANSLLGMDYGFVRRLADKVYFVISDGSTSFSRIADAAQDTWEHFVGVYDSVAGTATIYKNGALISTGSAGGIVPKTNGNLSIGGTWYSDGAAPYFKGQLAAPKIYPRALALSEIKSLYMFPDDVIFGNITADLLTTGELITGTAQIGNGVIKNANIDDLSADKINAGTLAAARIAAGSLAADKITGGAIVVGGAAGDVNSGVTTIAGGKITALSITGDQIAANAITAVKILTDSITANKITGGALVIGSAAGDVNAGATTISGGKITALSVTASQLAANAVTADKILANTITGGKIAAGTITASNLLIAAPGAALNTDPNFEDSTAWATVSGSPSYTTTTTGKVGASIVRATNARLIVVSTKILPVDIAKTYRVRAWVRSSDAAINARLRISRYAADGSTVAVSTYGSATIPGTGVWTEIYAIYTPGATDNRVAFGIDLNSAGVAATLVDAQDVRIEETLPATLIQDGAITTDKIIASGISAGVLTSGYVGAARIETGSLHADKITSGTIDALQIKAGAIQTAKLSVLAASLVNPVSQTATLNGWGKTLEDGTGTPTILSYDATEKAIEITNTANGVAYSQSFLLDPNKIYRVAGKAKKSTATGSLYIGAYGTSVKTDGTELTAEKAAGIAFTPYNASRAALASSGTVYFSTTAEAPTSYMEFAYFIIGANRSVTECPNYKKTSGGVPTSPYLKASDSSPFWCAIKIFNWINGAASISTFFKDLTVSEVGGGEIIADNIKTGQIKSTNYSTTAGSLLDLDAGTMTIGGSADPDFRVDTLGAVSFTNGVIGTWAITDDDLYAFYYVNADNYNQTVLRGESDSTTGFIIDRKVSGVSYGYMLIGAHGGAFEANANIHITMASTARYAIVTNGIIQGDTVDTSDERMKSEIIATNTLDKLKMLSVTEWQYDDDKIKRINHERSVEEALRSKNVLPLRSDLAESDVEDYNAHRHIGPMAKDFNQLFGVFGGKEDGINLSDGIGVALRAIQELAEIVDAQKAEIAELRAALKLPEKKAKIEVNITDEEIAQTLDKHLAPAANEMIKELKRVR